MVRTLRTATLPVYRLGAGAIRIRRIRPGLIDEHPSDDAVIGPFAALDHAWIDVGRVVPMHQHKNDEILSYVVSGTMLHDDSAQQEREITPGRLMVMNTGRSLWHQEEAPVEPVEMLQIFVRPEAPDLVPNVQFYDRPADFREGDWSLLAGPATSGAPLTVRNRVHIFDGYLKAGSRHTFPTIEGMAQWAYVVRGEIEIAGSRLGKGYALGDRDGRLPPMRAVSDTLIVAFLSDVDAPAVDTGTQSGYRRGLDGVGPSQSFGRRAQ